MMAGGKRYPGTKDRWLAQEACTCWRGNQRATTCITCLRWRRLQAHAQEMREGLRVLAGESA